MIVRCKCDEDIFIIQYFSVGTNAKSFIKSPLPMYAVAVCFNRFVVVFKGMSQFMLLGHVLLVQNIFTFEALAKATIVPCMRCTQEICVGTTGQRTNFRDTTSKINLLVSSGVHSKLHNNNIFIGRFPCCKYFEFF